MKKILILLFSVIVGYCSAQQVGANQLKKDGTTIKGNTNNQLQADTSLIATKYYVGTTGSGTVTSVSALTLGTTGTDVSSTVANSTTTPVITLNIPTASSTNRGALSSTDWSTFNNKGSGTVTSVTGGSGLTGGTITTSGTLKVDTSLIATRTYVTSGASVDTSKVPYSGATRNVNLGSKTFFTTGSIGATGTRVLKSWFTDLEVTNAPTLGGVAASGSGGLVRTTSPTFITDITTPKILTDNTTFASQTGIIYKGGSRFIHDFNYGNNGTVTTTGNNTFIGVSSGNFTMGSTATLVGQSSYNSGFGNAVLSALTTGYENTAGGYQSMANTTSGFSNTAYGFGSLASNIGGARNLSIGQYSLNSATAPDKNTAIGIHAMNNATTPQNNTALGFDAMGLGAVSGSFNTALGEQSLYSLTSATYNIGVGYQSLRSTTTTATNNVAIGTASLYSNITNSGNAAIGNRSLVNLNGGYSNTAIGSNAGESATTATNSVFIGQSSGFNASQKVDANNSISIGYNSYTTASNQVVLGNSSITETILRANVNIGQTGGTDPLEVLGSIKTNGSNATTARLNFYSSNTNANSRNWSIISDQIAFGDFNIRTSNARLGDPASAGTSRLWISAAGNISLGATTDNGYKLEIVGETKLGGAITKPYNLYTSLQTLGATQYNVNLTNAGATYAITLPTAVGVTGKIYRIKQMSGTACTIATTSAQNIKSLTNTNVEPLTLIVGAGYIEFQSDGTNWIQGN